MWFTAAYNTEAPLVARQFEFSLRIKPLSQGFFLPSLTCVSCSSKMNGIICRKLGRVFIASTLDLSHCGQRSDQKNKVVGNNAWLRAWQALKTFTGFTLLGDKTP